MDSVISVFSTIWNVSTLLLTNWKYSVAFLFGLYTVAYVVREYTIWKRKRQYEKLGYVFLLSIATITYLQISGKNDHTERIP